MSESKAGAAAPQAQDSSASLGSDKSCKMRRQLFHNGLLEGRVFRPNDMNAAADKPRLVCVHGLLSSKDSHTDVLYDVVAKTGHLAFTYDMRGHGGSFGTDLDTNTNAEDLLNVIGEIGKRYPATRQTGVKIIASSYGCHVALEAYHKYLERKDDPLFEPEPYLQVPFLPPILVAPPLTLEMATGERRFLLKTKLRLSGGYLPPANLVTFMVDRYIRRELEGNPRALRLYQWIRTNFKPLKDTVETPTQAVINAIEEAFGKEGVVSVFAPMLSRMLTRSTMKTLREKYSGFMTKKMALYDSQFIEKEKLIHRRNVRRQVAQMFRNIKDMERREKLVNLTVHRLSKFELSKVIGKIGTLRLTSFGMFADRVLAELPLAPKLNRVYSHGGEIDRMIIGLHDKTCCMVDDFGNQNESVRKEYMETARGKVDFPPVGHMSDNKNKAQIELLKNIIINLLLQGEIERMEAAKKADAHAESASSK